MSEMTSSSPLLNGMRPEVARRRLASYGKRFGQAHLFLAYHAAFPLALTPDLLYRLWANFPRNISGELLKIPWVAVADLLLSSLCDEVGHELYEMDVTVRTELLRVLKANPNFGQQRITELSDFLLEYVQQRLDSFDPDVRDFAKAQHWTALAYTIPDKAALELAQALRASLEQDDMAEQVRIASLIETFAEPLEEFRPLLTYARGVRYFARGDAEGAITQFKQIARGEDVVEVEGIRLPIPKYVRAVTDEEIDSVSRESPELASSAAEQMRASNPVMLSDQIGDLRQRTIAVIDKLANKAREFEISPPPKTLDEYRRKLAENVYQVLVVGEAKRGKSAFINALIGRNILPTDVDIATTQVFRIRGTLEEAYRILFEDGSVVEITAADLPYYSSQAVADSKGIPNLKVNIRWIEVDLPAHFLPNGVSILDTPGLGSLYSDHALITQRFVPLADAVIFVLDSGQPIIQSELQFIDRVLNLTPNIFFIQTKIDLYQRKDWQILLRHNEEILRERFKARLVDTQIWPISNTHLMRATQTGDDHYLRVSRYRELSTALQGYLIRVSAWQHINAALQEAKHYLNLEGQVLAGRVERNNETSKSQTEKIQAWHNEWLAIEDEIDKIVADLLALVPIEPKLSQQAPPTSINAADQVLQRQEVSLVTKYGPTDSKSPAIGIDIGTSTCKLAWYNPNTNQAEIIRNVEGEEQTPSVVYFGEDHTLVGTPAQEKLEYEKERERVIFCIITNTAMALPGRSVKPSEVAAVILRKLKHDAEEQHFHQEITRIVLTYPASFSEFERDKMLEAAHLAGFHEVELLEEPIAAALTYAQWALKVGNNILFYDLGAVKFDLAVLVGESDGSFRFALAPTGIKHFGGDDFDVALYNYFDGIAREKLGRPISLTGKPDLHFLQECRRLKENLSSADRRLFKSLLEPGQVVFQHEIDRATFESLISTTVEETVRMTKSLLERSNAQGYTVDTMILIGGSSRIPLVQRLLDQSLSIKPMTWQHRDIAVALGAAYHASGLWMSENQHSDNSKTVKFDKEVDETKIERSATLKNKSDFREEIIETLNKAAIQIRTVGLPVELVEQFEKLTQQVYQPCVVAIVGQVKVGKSTFINALLGEDLAKVGTTETTATINYFRYGKIATDKPMRCVWRNGQVEAVDLAFVNSLHGNNIETLHRAAGIDHLEFYLLNHYLEQAILVDTPGTGAAVEEHQNPTAGFIHLAQQLRERHSAETQLIANIADVVIYLVNSTARETDRAFLEEFQQVTQGQSRAFNSIGVMAKIDLYPDVMNRRTELATKIAGQLRESLNTVVPVSAGLRRALDRLLENDGAGLRRLIEQMRRIPPLMLNKFLASEELYTESEAPDCPVTIDERIELLGNMPWTVFTTIARIAADPRFDVDAIKQQVNTIAGFDDLKEVLDRHFFKRSSILRCYRILNDVYQILDTIRYKEIPALRSRNRESAKQAEAVLEELDRDFSRIRNELEYYNADHAALPQVIEHPELFSSTELNELRALLGLYGIELEKRLPPGQVSFEYVMERQIYWGKIGIIDTNPLRRYIVQQIVSRYGFILEEISKRTGFSS